MNGDKKQDKQYWMACYYKSVNKEMALKDELNTCKNIMAVMRKGLVDKETELTRLRKVAIAAGGVFLGEGEHLCSEFEDAMERLEQALAELDKTKEGD